jgi:hypothetical protein
MSGEIPKLHTDCAVCFRDKSLCDAHRSKDGQPVPYEGPDLYEPSAWVREVVGQRYSAWSYKRSASAIFLCTGYDPRCGFWMVDETDSTDVHNVSERAIGRTFHRLWGAL